METLEQLAQQIEILIAMTADEQLLGVDGNLDTFDQWHSRLASAIDNGLDAASDRVETALNCP